ncbi:hypothetical protein B1757_12765 [Acidithiobacillus marinus]|uniref:Superinfection immunity protein n=1 Tax=Acidithiobacillus marinus TaxID=187490 RepID=A0A2I1DJ24_9PROT|nr:superinfection immunity protein [Acidithiobacillus marinus]PKY09863.1 hypothetical protein B1757_12765 [Acidithiobacillus marinus]
MLRWMTNSTTGFVVLLIIAVIVLLGVYLLPTLLAWLLACPQSMKIMLLNVFLGWTILAWIVALIWALVTAQDEGFDDDVPKRQEPWLR